MLKMTGYRLLVKPDAVETTYGESKIVLAQNEKLEKTGIQRGIVIDVGPSCWKAFREVDENGKEHNGKQWAVPGDYVLFARSAGRFVFDPFESSEDAKNEYLVMNDEDVLAIFEEGDNPEFKSEIQKKANKL